MSVDPREARDAVAHQTKVTLRELTDGPAVGLPDKNKLALEPDCDLARYLRGELDSDDLEVVLTIMSDGEILGTPKERQSGSNGH